VHPCVQGPMSRWGAGRAGCAAADTGEEAEQWPLGVRAASCAGAAWGEMFCAGPTQSRPAPSSRGGSALLQAGTRHAGIGRPAAPPVGDGDRASLRWRPCPSCRASYRNWNARCGELGGQAHGLRDAVTTSSTGPPSLQSQAPGEPAHGAGVWPHILLVRACSGLRWLLPDRRAPARACACRRMPAARTRTRARAAPCLLQGLRHPHAGGAWHRQKRVPSVPPAGLEERPAGQRRSRCLQAHPRAPARHATPHHTPLGRHSTEPPQAGHAPTLQQHGPRTHPASPCLQTCHKYSNLIEHARKLQAVLPKPGRLRGWLGVPAPSHPAAAASYGSTHHLAAADASLEWASTCMAQAAARPGHLSDWVQP
jgi:hypothetical protein